MIRELSERARTTSRNRIRIANTARPRIRRAVRALEGERAEDPVQELGAGDHGEPERDQQQDDHVDVAERPAAGDREGRDGSREDQADDPDRRQLRRKQICLQDHGFHGRKRIDGAWGAIRALPVMRGVAQTRVRPLPSRVMRILILGR